MAATWPMATGESADRIRTMDWSGTSLGPVDSWPNCLRNVVDVVLESCQPACVAWGRELQAVYNDAFLPVMPPRHESGLGLPFHLLLADRWASLEPVISATLEGRPQVFDDRSVANGPPRGQEFSFSFTPLRNDAGLVCGFHCVAHESSHVSRAAQIARRASESRYRALFNSIDEGFCVVEVAFDANGEATDFRFLETNPAFEEQTGLTGAVGKWMRELRPRHEQLWPDVYARVARTGQSTRFVEHARALGRWFNVFAFRVGPADAHQVAILFSDITERMEAEVALRAADRRKDEFLATLAHELRNPLAPLRNGLQLIRQHGAADAALRRTTALMDRQLAHLIRLVDDLLDVGRISSGKIELRPEPLPLARVLAASIEASRLFIEEREHEFSFEDDGTPYLVHGDLHRLTQVFTNLLSNACKYTQPGGRIRMTVMRQGGEVVVRVIDSGIGIPPEDTGRVFDLFSQVRAHQPLHSGGLGIGLSLVRSLVKMHGGSVEASCPGANLGSTFTVRLPLLELPAPAPEVQAPRVQPLAEPRRVVVADDNFDSAGTLAELLRLQGHEVWTASDGLEAVAQVSERHPHAILLDLGMPRMDGIEAAKRIRALPGGERPLLVALTGWGQHADRERTQAAGFDCHLVKPADPDEILGLIERSCGPSAAEGVSP
jgi:PAS domain S-box-containing protein